VTRGVFVVGTDTAVGKTHVACALVRALRGSGIRVAGMKPVAAGIDDGMNVNADVAALAEADGLDVPVRIRNPYAFVPPIAPHLAARERGIAIDVAVIAAAFAALSQSADTVVVEGAGGARVPLAPGVDMLDIPRTLGVPVLLVVGVRLGCLNHALLTADAIATRGLNLAGWVANRIEPCMLRADGNVGELASLLPAPCICDVAWGATPEFDPRSLSSLGFGLPGKAC
jgi:dethiobiotin synthetase